MEAFFLDSHYKITTGFFSENTIVLAEGEMLLDGIFQVKASVWCEDRIKFFWYFNRVPVSLSITD